MTSPSVYCDKCGSTIKRFHSVTCPTLNTIAIPVSTTPDTPEKCPSQCPKCGDRYKSSTVFDGCFYHYYKCGTTYNRSKLHEESPLCKEREKRIKAEQENTKLRELLERALMLDASNPTELIIKDRIRKEYEQLTKK